MRGAYGLSKTSRGRFCYSFNLYAALQQRSAGRPCRHTIRAGNRASSAPLRPLGTNDIERADFFESLLSIKDFRLA